MAQGSPYHDLSAQEVEQSLIGALVMHTEAIAIAKAIIKPADFEHELHQFIVEVIYGFDEEGKAINPVTVNAWIKHNPAITETNKFFGEAMPPGREGAFYLSHLAAAAPPLRDVEPLAQMLLEFALRRRARDALDDARQDIVAMNMSVPPPIQTALAPVVQIADEITERDMERLGDTQAFQNVNMMLRDIEEQREHPTAFACATRMEPLDKIIGGLYPGQLIIAGGRPGMGKSIIAVEFMLAAAMQDMEADYWSIEMPANECAARTVCAYDHDRALAEGEKPMQYEGFVKRWATPGMIQRAAEANIRLGELAINFFTNSQVTIQQIAAASRARSARSKKRRLVIIDHLHIIRPGDRYGGRRVDELSEITRAAKSLAKRIDCPVFMLAQLSRDIERREDKRPLMADFRDSGSIEQDADVVMALYRHQYYAKRALLTAKTQEQKDRAGMEFAGSANKLEVEVLKQRSGDLGTANLWIEPACSAIRGEEPVRGIRQGDLPLYSEAIDGMADLDKRGGA